jgi:orotidine 5'-phosphate decarboxylase subfamily 2
MNFTQRLRKIQRKNDSLLCVGLDTDINRIPEYLFEYGDPIYEFNRRIIDATKDLVCAYKINLAFYEATGEHGWYTIHQTLARIPEEIITIGDAKRGDIGNSADYYARLLVDDYEFSASTVNPYMGGDSVKPFLRNSHQGAFILALTSNPGARDFQYLKSRGKPLYQHVIAKAKTWNTKKNCGLVVGATRPRELQQIRGIAPDMPILIPGIGAQGGDLKSAVRYGCDKHGLLAVINASRSIIYAAANDDFAAAARTAAIVLRDEINTYRQMFF